MRDLAKDKAMCEAAYKGPWERTGEGWFNVPDVAKIVNKDEWGQVYITSTFAGQHQEANAHFIAEARQALPYWIAQYEAAQALIDEIQTLYERSQARIAELQDKHLQMAIIVAEQRQELEELRERMRGEKVL